MIAGVHGVQVLCMCKVQLHEHSLHMYSHTVGSHASPEPSDLSPLRISHPHTILAPTCRAVSWGSGLQCHICKRMHAQQHPNVCRVRGVVESDYIQQVFRLAQVLHKLQPPPVQGYVPDHPFGCCLLLCHSLAAVRGPCIQLSSAVYCQKQWGLRRVVRTLE